MEIRRFTEAEAKAASEWRYPDALAIYNGEPGDMPVFLDAPVDGSGYYVIAGDDGEMIGFCCFGTDATIPGQGPPPAGTVDVGISLDPGLIGSGLGRPALQASLTFARDRLGATGFRVAVASFNERSLRLFHRAGFTDSTILPGNTVSFVELLRRAD